MPRDRASDAGRPLRAPLDDSAVVSRAERLRALFSRFGRSRAGTAALEFAIVAIPFFMFVMMIFQIALYHFGLQSLDYATRVASRQIMIGAVPTGAQTLAGFKNTLLCPRFLMGFACSNVVVNAYKVALSSDEASGEGIYRFIDVNTKTLKPVPTTSTFCIGGPGDYILVDVSYQFPNFIGSLLATTGMMREPFLIRSVNFFRNEPFKGGASTC